jgi:DNA-binding XRE family transcriptional regulator
VVVQWNSMKTAGTRFRGISIEKMVKNLPVLQASIRLSQRQFSGKIGITRQSMVSIEIRKRHLPWSLYLALVLVFYQFEDSKKLMGNYKLFDEDII